MAHDDRITHLVLEAQRRIFRLAERDYAMTQKAISLDANIPYSTLRSYARGEAVMAVPAVLRLVGVMPDCLLSHLFEPVDHHLAANGGDEGDHDTLATDCVTFIGKHAQARHPNSPGGINIVESEDGDLKDTRRQLRARA